MISGVPHSHLARVHVTIVDERVITISPGKLLHPDAKVVIRDEWRGLVLGSVGHSERVDMAENDDGDPHEEKSLLPHFPAISIMPSGHVADLAKGGGLGLLEELDIGPG